MKVPEGLLRDVALGALTTLEVGGPASYFLEATSTDAVLEATAWARDEGIPVLLLGGGSNLVCADRGFPGLALRVATRGMTWTTLSDGRVRARAAAGEPWDAFVAETVARDLAGLECLSGIPGAVGATPIQNVGAYGREVADVLGGLTVLRLAGGATEVWAPADCGFGYRDSALKHVSRGELFVVDVAFDLTPSGAPCTRYAEVARATQALGRTPRVADVRELVLELRRAKSMVMDPKDENRRSVGSFFTNPIVDPRLADEVSERALRTGLCEEGQSMPRYPTQGDRVKLSAAWLIERAGFRKGHGDASVGLSSRHTLAITNRGGATAADVLALARAIQRGVAERFGVTLTVEPELVGFLPEEVADLR